MATQGWKKQLTITAANDFRVAGALYKAVNFDGDFSTDNGQFCAGLAASQPNSGQHLSVTYLGVAKAYIGGAISSAGVPLTCAASGWLAVAASGDYPIARSIGTCSSGDLAEIMLNVVGGTHS